MIYIFLNYLNLSPRQFHWLASTREDALITEITCVWLGWNPAFCSTYHIELFDLNGQTRCVLPERMKCPSFSSPAHSYFQHHPSSILQVSYLRLIRRLHSNNMMQGSFELLFSVILAKLTAGRCVCAWETRGTWATWYPAIFTITHWTITSYADEVIN